eukprot:1136201-Pelagomonas_calceolata.AAC.1
MFEAYMCAYPKFSMFSPTAPRNTLCNPMTGSNHQPCLASKMLYCWLAEGTLASLDDINYEIPLDNSQGGRYVALIVCAIFRLSSAVLVCAEQLHRTQPPSSEQGHYKGVIRSLQPGIMADWMLVKHIYTASNLVTKTIMCAEMKGIITMSGSRSGTGC